MFHFAVVGEDGATNVGDDERIGWMFSSERPEQRVPKEHPLRPMREIVDRALASLSPQSEVLYSHTGRPSISPEKLLRALLLQAFYSVPELRGGSPRLDQAHRGDLRKTHIGGRDKVRWTLTLTATAYNAIRLPRLFNGLTHSA